jgi:regulatory protein
MYERQLTKEQALKKLKHYCAYQERSHSEVKEKLYSVGISKKHHDQITATLIEEGYLNEERFAIAFAGGKFRVKQWGRVKIIYELKQKQVSAYNIKKALKAIDLADYLKTLQKLYKEKWNNLKDEEDWLIRLTKTKNYLLQKGYEAEMIKEVTENKNVEI